MRIIFVCTSNQDRSPALENYFKETHPEHEYRSAGINKYFTEKKNTHYLTHDDIVWADFIVYAETVHYEVAQRNFSGLSSSFITKPSINLNLGEYKQGQIGEDYLTAAEAAILKYMPQ